jgi:membrane protein required for beta-lactamase induction
MRRDWLTWFLLAFLIAVVTFCMPARAAEQDVLQYVAAMAKQNADRIADIRADVAALKADRESNTWMLRLLIGGMVSGGIGMLWPKMKGKGE